MNRKQRFLLFLLFPTTLFSFFSCGKESSVDLSQRFGNWTVVQCTEPKSEGTVIVPDENGIFAAGDKIEYTSPTSSSERIRLTRTIQIKGSSQLFEDNFICTLNGDTLTLLEEVYGGETHALSFAYKIQYLDGTQFRLKRVDLGKDEGIVTMKRL